MYPGEKSNSNNLRVDLNNSNQAVFNHPPSMLEDI